MSLSKGVLLRRTTAYLFLSNNNLQPSRPASRRLQRSDARPDKFLKASAAPLDGDGRLKVTAPPAKRVASGSPLEGRRQLTRLFKSEIRNTKYETNSNDQNTNDKNLKPLRHSTLQCGLIRCYDQNLCLCFPCLKHLNIRILYLFRPILYDGRYSNFVFPMTSLSSRRNGRTFPGPPLEVVA